jgi:hypothetical protein
LRADRPYGFRNKDLYDSRIVDVADELQMISWRSNKKDPKEVIIPTGCGSYVLTCDKKNYEYQQCGGDGKWPRKLEQLNCK